MVVAQVELFSAGREFAVLRVVKTADGPVVRVLYHGNGRTIESKLHVGVNGLYVGTTLFDIIVPQGGYSVRIRRVSGSIRMGAVMPYKVRGAFGSRCGGCGCTMLVKETGYSYNNNYDREESCDNPDCRNPYYERVTVN